MSFIFIFTRCFEQEESEQAISSYRTAIRLLPGDHRPMVYMAKELLRTNFLSLALHVLLGALELCPKDPGVLNELGVAYMKLGKLDSAIQHFEVAVHALENTEAKYNPHKVAGQAKQGREDLKNRMFSFKKSCGFEIYNNYATALRKMDRFEDALIWYEKCLAANPSDASIFASKGESTCSFHFSDVSWYLSISHRLHPAPHGSTGLCHLLLPPSTRSAAQASFLLGNGEPSSGGQRCVPK